MNTAALPLAVRRLMRPLLRAAVPFIAMIVGTASMHGQWVAMSEEADSIMQVGIQNIYNVQFAEAHRNFTRVIQLDPTNPAGYFLDAMIDWWKVNIAQRRRTYDQSFLDKIQRVIDVCDRELTKDPQNLTALFFKGGSLGFRGRYYAMRESMVNAVNDGRVALEMMNECKKIAPANHDIMLGTGTYNYFAAMIPEKYPLVKPLMALFPGGDKDLGILQLEAAARTARYARVEASVVLLNAFYDFEKNPTRAMPIAKDLHERFPDNPYFHRYMGRCYVQLGPLDTMELIWRDVLVKYLDKQYGYDNPTAREALYYIGLARMIRGDHDMALKYFYKCDEACRSLDEDPSGFMTKVNIKIGNIYDLQGKRKLAVKQYDKVLSWSDRNGSHDEARRYKEQPYR